MKNLFYIAILLTGLLMACEDEPQFPDPGFDLTNDVIDTVRRDTVDTYHLKMRIKAPNGLDKIQILNGQSYQLIEDIAEYRGKKDFDFKYPIDLTGITNTDSTMYYIVKVIDKDLRTYNKAFALTVKRFSEPTVTIKGVEGTLGLVSPVFELKALFETGLYSMMRYRISFEGSTIDEGTFEEGISEYDYSYLCNLPIIKGPDYSISIELEDSRGEVKTTNIVVRLIDLQYPTKVITNKYSFGNPSLDSEWQFYHNEHNFNILDSVNFVRYANVLVDGYLILKESPGGYRFSYNSFNKVDTVYHMGILEDDSYGIYNYWVYNYDDQHRLTSVKNKEESEYDIIIDDWHEDGRPLKYAFARDYPAAIKTIPYYTHASGEQLCAESWMITGSTYRGQVAKMSPIAMPTCVTQMPTFLPFSPGNALHEHFQVLTMFKYGHEEINRVRSSSSTLYYTYTYMTNTTGRLDKVIKKQGSTVKYDYVFVYGD